MSKTTYNTKNEPIKSYLPNSKEKLSLKKCLDEMSSNLVEIPIIINGQDVYTNDIGHCVMPHNHQHIIAKYHKAGLDDINNAIESSLEAWDSWSKLPIDERASIFEKAAHLLKTSWRDRINAATMLGQSKNVFQAEIDAACELIDFFNFNNEFAKEMHNNQPLISPDGMKNSLEYRSLEGFIFAVAPFNFSSISANLPCAPALMGNVALWKPASSSVFSSYYLMKLLQEAGLPDGVINFIPGSGRKIGDPIIENTNLAGVHFTGSTEVFQGMWNKIGKNISNYKTYPRIVGETGGKDFILAHKSSNIDELVTACVRGAFEYQGQKCSAASRAYIPKEIWDEFKIKYIKEVNTIKMGDVTNFSNFMNAVIDESSFDRIEKYIAYAKADNDTTIITGGNCDKTKGYFIEPTTILTKNKYFKTMCEEIFGPVLTIYVYEESWQEICKIVDSTSPYALTGAIFASDPEFIASGKKMLTHSAGNFYINDKPTGAVVGQQPFGGSRASGTNDKAGSPINLYRWVSVRTIKETFDSPTNYRYPFMDEE